MKEKPNIKMILNTTVRKEPANNARLKLGILKKEGMGFVEKNIKFVYYYK